MAVQTGGGACRVSHGFIALPEINGIAINIIKEIDEHCLRAYFCLYFSIFCKAAMEQCAFSFVHICLYSAFHSAYGLKAA